MYDENLIQIRKVRMHRQSGDPGLKRAPDIFFRGDDDLERTSIDRSALGLIEVFMTLELL
jgi:hypothetical protein